MMTDGKLKQFALKLRGEVASIGSCEFSGGVTPLDGITRDDIRYRFSANSVISDTYEDALIYVEDNTTATTVTVNVPKKVEATWTEEAASHFETDATGRITYIAERSLRSPITIAASLDVASGTNKILKMYVAINGVAISKSALLLRVDAGDPKALTISWQHEFNKDDYVEVFVENTTDNTSIILRDGTIRVR